MGKYAQAKYPLEVTTPLGKDVLLLVGLSGYEAVSRLYSFELELLAEKTADVAFDKLLGQKVTASVVLPGGSKKRYFSGICNRVSQGEQDIEFTAYHLEIVPQFWLLTRARRAASSSR